MKKQKEELTREQIFALRSHVVRIRDGKYFTAPTLDQSKFSGPYKSLQACCAAIARKLGEEVTLRRIRLEKSHARRR